MSSLISIRRVVVAVSLAAVVALLPAGQTDASSIRLPLATLSERSPVVVRGRVERMEPAWTADGRIETTVYLRLADVPRGHLPAGGLIPVRVPGGRVDGLTMVSSEQPTFEHDEEVYLFLSGPDQDAYRLTADRQGKFEVAGDRAINRSWKKEFRLKDLDAGVREGRWPAGAASTDEGSTPLGPATLLPSDADSASLAASPDGYQVNNARWFGPKPMEESYLINVNSNDAWTGNGSGDAFRNAIIAAADAWNNAGAAFAFKDGGNTTWTSWQNDGRNVVYWQNLGSSPTLAEAQWWKYDNGQIIDVDLRFNDYYAWDVTGAPSAREPDLQSVATHEFGHFLSLGHDDNGQCPNSTPVMCAIYNLGTLKRALGANDIAGIRAIYGATVYNTSRVFLPMTRR